MWKLSASDRLARWRDFRKSLATVPVDEAIEQTVQFWRSCPFTPFYLEARQPETWPSPWQLLDENYYCDLAKALGMLYTIQFTQHGPELAAEIHVYNDARTGYVYCLPVWHKGNMLLIS